MFSVCALPPLQEIRPESPNAHKSHFRKVPTVATQAFADSALVGSTQAPSWLCLHPPSRHKEVVGLGVVDILVDRGHVLCQAFDHIPTVVQIAVNRP